ncbi:breast carcinoma-amplified sequence 3 homolog [Drosophila busckii]|uniref:breast carcinoma-amplified sequence 3 homolog n=1 Tax=Drosophila busckii TaxID=30019 RepID=UPI00083F040C|nr:breast carcinoma-amplified sequence 3 homolog [Drosophila busckii]
MSADSPRRHQHQQQHYTHSHSHSHHHHHHTDSHSGGGGGGGSGSGGGGAGGGGGSSNINFRGGVGIAMPAIVPPQTVSDRSILDSAIGFINDVTLVHQPLQDPKDTITWARFETSADVSDPRFGDDWELEGNAAPPLLLILGYGLGVQVWAIPANGEAVEVLSWRHGVVTALRVLPTPAAGSGGLADNGRADVPMDAFAEKRPLVALVDGGSAAASNLLSGGHTAGHSSHSGGSGGSSGGGMGSHGSGSHFSAVNFVSLKTGAQVKTIKFKNAVLDIQANRSAVVISFHERLAVFDARTLEDRMTITTCFPSPGINPNPIALGPRWLAYAEHKLLPSKRSGGGCDGEGVPSYTATVLNAAKSFGKGLRELGESVAAGLTGATTAGSGNSSKSSSFDSACGGPDAKQSGVVTIIDVKHPIKDYSPTTGTPLCAMSAQSSAAASSSGAGGGDPIIAHFVAHSEALVAMEFDASGMLLLTADRRGHDFHVFRIQPHPVGSSLAAVHHLYVLHRGDTSAKVQHIAFSLDSRWAAVSTLRGTTHVFPITPYGGAMGVRTHTSLHVVNKLSRFHRSAGLGADGRSSSPISHSESTTFVQSLQPYHNPTLPPFPRPTVVQPLAQLRQPFVLGSPPGGVGLGHVGGSAGSGGGHAAGHSGHGVSSHQRQRLSSLSDDSGKPLSVCATFAKSRAWLLEPPTATREAPHRQQRKAVDSLFVMAGHGALIQYDLDTKLASHVAKEKICDDTPIELEVEAKAQWNLGRRKDGSQEIIPPLALDNWLIKDRHASLLMDSANHFDDNDERAESWLSQVEIITHAGPHRRLWMGPQFVFKNYNTPSGSNLNHVDAEAVEIGVTKSSTTTLPSTAAGIAHAAPSGAHVAHTEHSSPLTMPHREPVAPLLPAGRSGVPVLIESGSYSSIEQSPKLMDRFRHGHLDSDYGHGDMRLKEDLADAMRESPSTAAARRETGNFFGNDQLDGLAYIINNNSSNNKNNNNNNHLINKTGSKQIKNSIANNILAQQKQQQPKAATVANSSSSSSSSNLLAKPQSNTAAVGIDGELATVVNIDVFDDQLSLSSISTNSRLSLEGPPSQSSPPLSLTNGGLIDTNLMYFSESAAVVAVAEDNSEDAGAATPNL